MIKENIDLSGKTILITGAAGFIGSFLAKRLLEGYKDSQVVGFDNLNHYYDVSLKEERLKTVNVFEHFYFVKGDLSNKEQLEQVFEKYHPEIVVNLAAQAGVRYSITNPDAYIESNIVGFFNVLECCRNAGVEHLLYASSSSVYGSNKKVPYAVGDMVDHPVSLYAATKKSNELMAHAYSKLYGIPSTGLRFFTVYGPMGRPDMAYYKFADKIVKGETIQIYNYGDMYRDFTYIDDIITGVVRVMVRKPKLTEDGVPYKVYNIGNNRPESLMDFVEILEKLLKEAGVVKESVQKEYLPMQPGDVYQTYADVEELERDTGFSPKTSLEEGIRKFVEWYKA
ncbi:GDP-mannose 4,6-dehydratase [Lachnospiraceae bacterium 62-26]